MIPSGIPISDKSKDLHMNADSSHTQMGLDQHIGGKYENKLVQGFSKMRKFNALHTLLMCYFSP